jgi:hypothetical protein
MCFTLGWIEQLCVWIIMVVALVAIINLVLPWLTSMIGIPIVAQIIRIVLWAVVAIACVYIIFGLLACVLGAGGGLIPFHR